MIVFMTVLGALIVVVVISCLALWLASILQAFFSDESSSMHAPHNGMHGKHAPKAKPCH